MVLFSLWNIRVTPHRLSGSLYFSTNGVVGTVLITSGIFGGLSDALLGLITADMQLCS